MTAPAPRAERVPLGVLPGDGGTAELIRLRAGQLTAELLTHGAHLVSLRCPDRAGEVADVLVGLADWRGYVDASPDPHLGATVGRYANRIAGARFELDGVEHTLAPNEGPNQLHGGPRGFDSRPWSATTSNDEHEAAVTLTLTSPDGDQGFPGTVHAIARYAVSVDGVLAIDLEAVTDAPTVVNLTNHGYWNLSGAPARGRPFARATVADHEVTVAAGGYVPVDADMLPTGEVRPVDGTVFDLRSPTRLGDRLAAPELAGVGGYDHCLMVDGATGELRHVAEVHDPASGRVLSLATDQPAVQLYTSNAGVDVTPPHGAVCLECQLPPDSPNQPAFPSPVLRPGERYRHRQRLRFSTR